MLHKLANQNMAFRPCDAHRPIRTQYSYHVCTRPSLSVSRFLLAAKLLEQTGRLGNCLFILLKSKRGPGRVMRDVEKPGTLKTDGYYAAPWTVNLHCMMAWDVGKENRTIYNIFCGVKHGFYNETICVKNTVINTSLLSYLCNMLVVLSTNQKAVLINQVEHSVHIAGHNQPNQDKAVILYYTKVKAIHSNTVQK